MAESIKKFIIKDAHGGTKESGSFSVVGEVHVNIVPGYGEPYAESEYVNGILTITIHNIDGNGITEITTDSQEGDEAVNTVTIKTNANPEGVVLEVRNGSKGDIGPQGPPGADRQPVEAGDVIISHTTGDSEEMVMSQKAVTDTVNAVELKEISDTRNITGIPFTQGIKLLHDGTEEVDQSWAVTGYIPCNAGDTFGVDYGKVENGTACLVFYDEYKNYVRYYSTYQGSSSSTVYNREVTPTDANIKFVRFCFCLSNSAGARHGQLAINGKLIWGWEDIGRRLSNMENSMFLSSATEREYTAWGLGDNYLTYEMGHLIPGRLYRIVVPTPSDFEFAVTKNTTRFNIFAKVDGNEATCHFYGVKSLPIPDTFDFIAAENDTYAIGFRATSGAKVSWKLIGFFDDEDFEGKTDMFLGKLLQMKLSASGLSAADNRVSMASCVTVPHVGATISFKLPYYYACGIRSGNQSDNLSNNDWWFTNGMTFTFADDVRYFRLCFAKCYNWSASSLTFRNVTVAEIEELIESGDIRVMIDSEPSIIERNHDNEKYVKAVMRPFVSGTEYNSSLHRLPIFAHTSDVHGDAKRFGQILEYCDYLKVDAALVSGDLVAKEPAERCQYVADLADEHTTKVLTCIGNHDARSLSEQAQSEQLIGYLIDKNGSTTSGADYPTYYYHDFEDKAIRVISLNIYESGHTSDNCLFTQTQCEWFVGVLASTPANYGVLVMLHSPEDMPVYEGGNAFYQTLLNFSTLGSITGKPLSKIIDAFINGENTTITYGNISISADFSELNEGVEFIAYVNGHLHADRIGYLPDTQNLQLNLNVTCGLSIYGTQSPSLGLANLSDLPRDAEGATQDAFNIYAIDRTAKVVRIARVGSNVSGMLTERKYMYIPYAG